MTAPKCIPLQAISDESVGGKAEGLARLLKLGFAVPDGFVIVAASAQELPADLDAHYARIGAGKVAVRSSAIGEDSGDASFAGQYETVLNVEGAEALRAAIEACVRSLSNARASAYRDEKLGAGQVQMNVVVQRMVDARAAGVLFTANPINARRDQVVVDAVPGLGEALVSGRATPDHWILRRDASVVEADIQAKAPVARACSKARSKPRRDTARRWTWSGRSIVRARCAGCRPGRSRSYPPTRTSSTPRLTPRMSSPGRTSAK
jgi:pyruvate,water dikinase